MLLATQADIKTRVNLAFMLIAAPRWVILYRYASLAERDRSERPHGFRRFYGCSSISPVELIISLIPSVA